MQLSSVLISYVSILKEVKLKCNARHTSEVYLIVFWSLYKQCLINILLYCTESAFIFFYFFFWQHTCEQLFLDQLGLFLRCDMQLVHSASLKGEPWLPVLQREPHKSQDTSSKTNLTMASKAKAEEQPEFQVSPPKWNGDVPEAKHQHVRTATGVSNCWEFIATP